MNKLKRRYFAILFSSIVVFELLFGMLLHPPFIEIAQINTFIFILILACVCNSHRQKRSGIITGFNFFIALWTIWLVFAWIGKYFFVSNDIWKYRNQSIEFSKFFMLNILALVFFVLVYLLGYEMPQIKFKNNSKQMLQKNEISTLSIDNKALNIYLNAVSLVCVLICVIFYVRMGVLTMLYSGNIDGYRFDVQGKNAFFNYINYLIPILMILKLNTMRIGRIMGLGDYIIIGLLFFMEFVYGSKMLFIFPIVVTFCLAYMDEKTGFINVRNIIFAFITMIVCIIYTNIRGLGQAISNSLVADFFLFVGGEFRDATRFIKLVDLGDIHINTVETALLKCIPHEIREILGIDQYIKSIGTYIKSSLGYSFAGGSTRIGILAEMYTFGRMPAVIICFAMLGFIISRIDKRINNDDDIWKKTIRMILVFQVSWFLLAESYIQLPALIIYTLLYIFVQLLFKLLRMINSRKTNSIRIKSIVHEE